MAHKWEKESVEVIRVIYDSNQEQIKEIAKELNKTKDNQERKHLEKMLEELSDTNAEMVDHFVKFPRGNKK